MECLNCNSGRLVYDKSSDAYVCLDCNYKYHKQYFFVSHSHLDLEKVRIIRNIIEETFFYEPILFFLKCLSDDNEIHSLIQREIYERIWFVYCKSKNAENSEYVQAERAYLEKLKSEGKQFNELTVELDKFNIWDDECYDYIRKQIAYQIRMTKPFICSSSIDAPIAAEICNRLQCKGYSVWFSNPLLNSADWGENILDRIKKHCYKNGCIMVLISEKSLDSKYVHEEIEYALAQNAIVLPIICDDGQGDVSELWQQVITRYPLLSQVKYLTIDSTDPYNGAKQLFKQLSDFKPNL